MKVITETGRAHLIRYLRFYSKSSKKNDTQQLPSDYTFFPLWSILTSISSKLDIFFFFFFFMRDTII